MGELGNISNSLAETEEDLRLKFKLSIFGILGYKPLKNDAQLINFLNKYRTFKKGSIK